MVEKVTALRLKNISKYFGSVCAVKDMNLDVEDGEFVSLLGPSGCGKTTLLRIIAGFETPDTGKVLLDGKNILNVPPNKRPMNMVFQRYALFPHMNVYENIAFSQFLKKRPREEINEKVKKMLELVQLEGFELRRPDQLSGGQCQRIALARALINEPRVLLLDEPLGALDLKIRKQMQIELKNIQEKLKITFIYVTHDQEEALVMSDRIVLMRAGETIQIDTPKRIYNYPNSRFAATFIGESNVFEGTISKVSDKYLIISVDGISIIADRKLQLDEGTRVFAAVRLEKVKRVDRARGRKFDNQLTGVLEDVVFFGHTVKYYVKLSENFTVIAEEEILEEDMVDKEIAGEKAKGAGEVGIGDSLTIGFMSKDVNVFLD
jgi:spermidine/putrescine transport system ATP-binding protein